MEWLTGTTGTTITEEFDQKHNCGDEQRDKRRKNERAMNHNQRTSQKDVFHKQNTCSGKRRTKLNIDMKK